MTNVKAVTQCAICHAIGRVQAYVRGAYFLYQGLLCVYTYIQSCLSIASPSQFLACRSFIFVSFYVCWSEFNKTFQFDLRNLYLMKFTNSLALVCLALANVEAFVVPPQHEWMVSAASLLLLVVCAHVMFRKHSVLAQTARRM
jgi:hypothetical protein